MEANASFPRIPEEKFFTWTSAKLSSSAQASTAPSHRAAAEAQDDPIQDDVLARRHLRLEADAELDERRQAPGDTDRPRVGAVDAAQDSQECALARAVATDDRE